MDGGQEGHSEVAVSLEGRLADEHKRKLIGTIRKMGLSRSMVLL